MLPSKSWAGGYVTCYSFKMSGSGKSKMSRRRSLRNLKYHLPAVVACDHPAAAALPCDTEETVEYGSMWLPGHADVLQPEKTCTGTECKDEKTAVTTSNLQTSSLTEVSCGASTLFGNTPELMRSCQRDESSFFATPVSVTGISRHEPESKNFARTPQLLKGNGTPEALSDLCSMVSPVFNYATPSFGCALNSSTVVQDCLPNIITTNTYLSILDQSLHTCAELDPEVDSSSRAIAVSISGKSQHAKAYGPMSATVGPHAAVSRPTVADVSPMILGFEFDYPSSTQLSPQQQHLIPASEDVQQCDGETVPNPKVHFFDSDRDDPRLALDTELAAVQISSTSGTRSFTCDTVPELNYTKVQDYLRTENYPLPGETETECQLSTSKKIKTEVQDYLHSDPLPKETESQLRTTKQCKTEVQDYLYSKPVPGETESQLSPSMQIKKAKKERRQSFWDPLIDSHADQAHTDIEKVSRVSAIAENASSNQIGQMPHSSSEESGDTTGPLAANEHEVCGTASQKVKANKRKRLPVDVALLEANAIWLPVEHEGSTASQLPLKGRTFRRRSSLRLYRNQSHTSATWTPSSSCADDFDLDAGTTTTNTSNTEANGEANTTSSAVLCEVVPTAKSSDEVGEHDTISDDRKVCSVQIAEADEVEILPELEDLYRNKNYKRPVNKTWETIFEAPSKGKLTSKQKFRRYLQFEEVPASKQKRRWKKAALNGWPGNKLSEINDGELIVKLDMLQQDIQNQIY